MANHSNMSGYNGFPRINQREPRHTDWRKGKKFYSSELATKFYPTLDTTPPYRNGGVFKEKHTKSSVPSSSNQDSKQPKVITDVFTRFADTTSLHTMPFLNRASRWYAKMIWVVIFLAASGAWIFHSYYLIRTFLSYETSSSIKIVFEAIKFPSITLCNINPARRAMLEEYGSHDLLEFLTSISPTTNYTGTNTTGQGGVGDNTGSDTSRKKRSVNDDDLPIEAYEYTDYNDLTDFDMAGGVNWTKYLDIVNDYDDLLVDDTIRDYVKINTVFKEMLAAIPDSNRTKMGHQLKTMMMSCSYNSADCTVQNFSRWLDINYGICWTFNSFELSSAAIASVRSGSNFGLDLVLYIQSSEYIQGLPQGQGLRLFIHPFGSMPFLQENGMSVAPGLEYYLSLRMVNQTRLGGKYGVCGDGGAFTTYYGNMFNYSTQGCINTCLDRTIAKECDCYRRTQRQYYNSIDLQKGFCKTFTEVACSRKYTTKFSNGELNCGCNQACQTIEYQIVSSFDSWPGDALWFSLVDAVCIRDTAHCDELKAVTEVDEREEILRENFLHLNIFYRDLNVETIEEKEAYGFVQFGSDLGGAIGLWIGASLITVFEFLELSCQLCNFCRRSEKYKERKRLMDGSSQNPRDNRSHMSGDSVHRDKSRPFVEERSRSLCNNKADWQRQHSRVDTFGGIV